MKSHLPGPKDPEDDPEVRRTGMKVVKQAEPGLVFPLTWPLLYSQ